MSSTTTPEQWVWRVAGLTMLVKLALAAAIPMTQDEAYFVMWGSTPSLGYSEHPPMIGWIEHLLLYLGRNHVWVRTPAILGTLSIGYGLFWALREFDAARAAQVACLYLLSPIHLIYVIVTTDTALIVVSFWSAFFLFRAVRSGHYRHFALAGALLGCAFLSKYFSALLLLAYVVYFLFTARDGRRWRGFPLLLACTIPFGLITLYWNYTHSWMEVRYPSYRDDDAQFALDRPLLFLAQWLYLWVPAGGYWILRQARTAVPRLRESPVAVLAALYAIPMGTLAVLSLRKNIGLHWFLSFAAFAYPIAWALLDATRLRKAIRLNLIFSGIHLVALTAILLIPLDRLRDHEEYATLAMGFYPKQIVERLEPFEKEFRFATDGYGTAGLMSFHHPRKRFAAFGAGSHHGRNDDFVTDFNEWAGENALIFIREDPDLEWYGRFFDSVELQTIDVEGAVFRLVLGRGFRLDAYRDEVLTRIRDRYFDVPAHFPMSEEYFRAKYFEGVQESSE